jgi:hypothetical protein
MGQNRILKFSYLLKTGVLVFFILINALYACSVCKIISQ